MMEKAKKILIVIGGSILLAGAAIVWIVWIFASPWVMIAVGTLALPNPPRPVVTYGEFPFRLEYELEGEVKVIEDVVICEFDGFGANEGRGKFRQWKSHTKNGNDRITLLKIDDMEIFCLLRAANWYMGDAENYSYDELTERILSLPQVWRATNYNPKKPSGYIVPSEELWEKYKLRLISWESSPPIENTFREAILWYF